MGSGLTLQDVGLHSACLTRALQSSAVDEIENDTVGQLLSILVGSIRSVEVGEVEALGDTLLVGFRWTQDEIAHRVNLNPSAFPELGCVRHSYTFH
jgi:hypothetical protein